MSERLSAGGVLRIVFGAGWGQRVVVGGAIALYGWLVLARPEVAAAGVRGGAETFGGLFTLILASLLLASALETLLPREAVAATLGEAAGARGVVLAGLLGGLLPGGPYATYPIIRSVADRGASYPAMVTMLLGYNLIGIGRIPFGLGIFDPAVVLLRVSLAVVATAVAGVIIHALSQRTLGQQLLSE